MTSAAAGLPSRRVLSELSTVGVPYTHLGPDALALMERRTRAERRARWIGAAILLVIFTAYFWLVFGPLDVVDGPRSAEAWMWTVAASAFCLAMLIGQAVDHAQQRRILADLPRRVARDAAQPVRVVLGRPRLVFLALVMTVQAAWVVLEFVVPAARWIAWPALVGLVACIAAAVFGMREELKRPDLAVDPVSLGVDERQRTRRVYGAGSLPLILAVMPLTGHAPVWLFTASFFVSYGTRIVVLLVGLIPNMWRFGRRAAPIPWTAVPGPAAPST